MMRGRAVPIEAITELPDTIEELREMRKPFDEKKKQLLLRF